jgi:hypothetical protein
MVGQVYVQTKKCAKYLAHLIIYYLEFKEPACMCYEPDVTRV